MQLVVGGGGGVDVKLHCKELLFLFKDCRGIRNTQLTEASNKALYYPLLSLKKIKTACSLMNLYLHVHDMRNWVHLLVT